MGQKAPSDVETVRLSEVRSLDLAALRPKIDRLTRLAQTIAGAPIAYVALIEADHIWNSGFPGAPEGFLDRDKSTASLIAGQDETFWTGDAQVSAPDHPWVAGPPYVRFYCGAPIRLASGLPIGAFCVSSPEPREPDPELIARIEDIAALLGDEIERLRAERSLAAAASEANAARRLMESFVQSAPVALAMTDRDLRFIQVSPRWCEEHGIEGEEVIGRTIPELFPKAYSRWERFWAYAMAGNPISRDRLQVPMPDGSFRWVRAEMAPWRDPDGEVGGLLLMTNEISDMINSLERAESSEQRLRMAVGIAEVLVYEVDFRNRTLKVDGAADTFFTKTMTYEDVSHDIWETVHPEDRPAALALWRRHLKDGVPFRTEYRMARDDGREVWAFAACELVQDEKGEPERLVGVLKNITERRRSEATVGAARDAAENANRAKSEFLANMSHEIRTPLNGVMGVAAALARTTLSPSQVEMVDLIETSGRALEAILSDVLDFSRIESGRLELKPEGFDLEGCLRSAAALFEPNAAAKGLDFTLDIAPEAQGGFEGDPIRLRQIVSNLLSNAVKFTTEGGVTLTALARDEGDVTLVTIAVTDTGIGFDPDFKARLFERFEQADGSITRRFGGSGLGLAISRSLAQAMGGMLEASSIPGRGSTFILSLQLARTDAPLTALPTAAANVEEMERAPRVLLAEDHPVNRRVVELILGSAGVDLTCVENGAEAVAAAARGAYDLILMDMQMPVMDGLSAIRAIRMQERTGPRRTPIWGLSANALPEHVAASRLAGADGHLTKPVSADALFSVITEACAMDGQPREEALSA